MPPLSMRLCSWMISPMTRSVLVRNAAAESPLPPSAPPPPSAAARACSSKPANTGPSTSSGFVTANSATIPTTACIHERDTRVRVNGTPTLGQAAWVRQQRTSDTPSVEPSMPTRVGNIFDSPSALDPVIAGCHHVTIGDESGAIRRDTSNRGNHSPPIAIRNNTAASS